MPDTNPPEGPGDALPSASLMTRIGAGMRAPGGGGERRTARLAFGARTILLATGLAAVTVAIGSFWQAHIARTETQALLLKGESAGRDRERAAELGKALSARPLDAVLTQLRAHLPPGVRLAEAVRAEDGTLTLSIDTADPDALRAETAADAWLGRFRERGQQVREDGTIRVLLAGETD